LFQNVSEETYGPAVEAGVSAPVFFATGITVHLENKRTLEMTQKIAAHGISSHNDAKR
jgi:hypothetical protein